MSNDPYVTLGAMAFGVGTGLVISVSAVGVPGSEESFALTLIFLGGLLATGLFSGGADE